MSGERLSFGQFRFDFARRELTRQGVPVRLGSRALDILAALVSARGEIVSKDELLARVWPGQVVEENNLQVQVSALRKALDEDKSGQSHLVCVPRRGYRLIGLTETSPVSALPDKPSIAVLPFTNMSGDPEQAYFATGITEDIITELSRWREIMVKSRNATARYGPDSGDSAQIGRELGVQYILEGSVRKLGDRIRITAQLIDAASGNHIWADRFDRDEHEIFAVQDQIVRTIAGTLVGRVEAASAARAGRKPPESLAAYECLLRANALPLGDSAADAERKRLCETAIRLDPGYGRAYAWLAHAIFLEWFRDMGDSDAALDRALALAQKAVQLDENDTECKNMLGWVHLFGKSFDLAEQYMRRALELNPGDPEEHAWMGTLYSFLGKPDEAVEWFAQAKRLDPFFEPVWYWHMLGIAHFVARRYDDAIAVLSRSTTMPVWVPAYLAACHALMGRIDRAQAFAAESLTEKELSDSSQV